MYKLIIYFITLTFSLLPTIIFGQDTTDMPSVFHSTITELSPPYYCQLKLKEAKGVGIGDNMNHLYKFAGICSVKIPYGRVWVYQHLWVEIDGAWNCATKMAREDTQILAGEGSRGSLSVSLMCMDDPWLTKAPCVIDAINNNTNYTNFGRVVNPRSGVYPPFEVLSGQYPPLARNQALFQDALMLSILAARQEALEARQKFVQTFPNTINPEPVIRQSATSKPNKSKTYKRRRLFKNPKYNGYRLDCCLGLNKNCGKPAADAWCQSQGYRQAIRCRIDKYPNPPTFIIGSQTLCKQPFCKGFTEIECGD